MVYAFSSSKYSPSISIRLDVGKSYVEKKILLSTGSSWYGPVIMENPPTGRQKMVLITDTGGNFDIKLNSVVAYLAG